MSDNLGYTPGTGATVAADDIAGVAYQRIKVVLGADGTNDGDVSSANPLPVVWSSGTVSITGTVAATQSGTWNINNVSGTISLPTGASTAARQDTGNASLSSIDGKLTSGVAVTGAFYQDTQPVSAAALPLPSGAATSANQTTEIASLSSIDGKITAVNTGAVVIASGSVTANAGTNLNTSLLALEAGGNLATIAAKDFATQATLATRASEATLALVATEATLAALKAVLNLTPGVSSAAATGPMVQALVSDSPESYADNTIRPLSVTNEGRLRVSVTPAALDIKFFPDDVPDVEFPSYIASPWASSIW